MLGGIYEHGKDVEIEFRGIAPFYFVAALFAAQYFLSRSLIFSIAAGLIFFSAAGASLAVFETSALPTPKYRPSACRSFFSLANALSVV